MIRMVCSVLVLLLVFILPANAQIYKYTDADGSIRFTDDITLVPEGQRGQYTESVPEAAVQPETEAVAKGEAPVDGEAPAGGEAPAEGEGNGPVDEEEKPQSDDEAMIQRLNDEQQKLKAEYDILTEETKKLEEERKEVRTSAQLKDYNDKADKLNEKIEDYQQRVRAFEAERDEFNSRGAEAPETTAAE